MTKPVAAASHRNVRSGFTTAYLLTILVSLCAVGSLGADWGRVQLAKSEMQRSADAAARYAATALRRGGSYSLARSRAKEVALENRVDGQPLVLDDADIRFGRWEAGTFIECAENAYPRADAVRVNAERSASRQNALQLTWANLIGAATHDVRASSTVMIRRGNGLVGLNSVKIAGNGSTDSYDPQVGPYSTTNRRSRGTVVSNGPISLSGNARVNGEAMSGDSSYVLASPGAVSGAISSLPVTLRFPAPTLPANYVNLGTLKLSNKAMTLSAGDYLIDDLSISGPAKLSFTGPVRLYIRGSLSMSGGTVETWQRKASNLEINMLSSSPVNFSGQADLYAMIYAPLSPVTQSGQADIYGGIIAASLEFTGSWKGGVHYDESLDWDLNLVVTVE